MLSHHNLYFTPPTLLRGGGEEKRKKINQNDIWLVSSEVKPSHVENRPDTVLWVQKIGWASSSLGCNYLLKTKQNKKCNGIYTPRDKHLSNLCTTRIQLCNVRVNCFACETDAVSQSCPTQPVLLQLHRLAHRMQEMPAQTLYVFPAPQPLP